jgi:transposase
LPLHVGQPSSLHCTCYPGLGDRMKQLTPRQKHSILVQYRPRSPTHSFAALAVRAGSGLKKSTIHSWYQRWDGTPASLQHKPVPGRPRVMSRAQVVRHLQSRIRSANRKPRAIHYTDLLPVVQRATDKNVSIQTLRRYGHNELGAGHKRTKKRTAAERK